MDLPLELAENLIERGVILHSDIFPDIDRGKFFVVIGVDEDFVAGFFFINSNINRAIWNKQEQLAMQYPMRKADYDFLRYDSFLCATNIITRSRKELSESIQENRSSLVGHMKQEHLDDVLEMVRNSKLFSNIEKQRFFY
jgi:hypothetical protein